MTKREEKKGKSIFVPSTLYQHTGDIASLENEVGLASGEAFKIPSSKTPEASSNSWTCFSHWRRDSGEVVSMSSFDVL